MLRTFILHDNNAENLLKIKHMPYKLSVEIFPIHIKFICLFFLH